MAGRVAPDRLGQERLHELLEPGVGIGQPGLDHGLAQGRILHARLVGPGVRGLAVGGHQPGLDPGRPVGATNTVAWRPVRSSSATL